MIKSIAFVTAKPAMERDSFIARYENGHAPLALRILPPWTFCDYRRNYVKPGTAIAPGGTGSASEPPFHDISEFWYEDETTVERFLRSLAETDVGPQITRDELDFMQRDKIMSLQVDERSSPSAALVRAADRAPQRPPVKVFQLARKAQNLSDEAFVKQHDSIQAGLPDRLELAAKRPLLAEHKWAYPVAGSLFDLPHLDFEAPLPDFDTIVSMWFWTPTDYEAFRALILDPELGENIVQAGYGIYEPSSLRLFAVDEYITPREDLLSAGADCPMQA